jgi:hypothetical protein
MLTNSAKVFMISFLLETLDFESFILPNLDIQTIYTNLNRIVKSQNSNHRDLSSISFIVFNYLTQIDLEEIEDGTNQIGFGMEDNMQNKLSI